MDSFSESYAEAREKFRSAAAHAGARLHEYGRDDLKGVDGERLVCDVAVLGPESGERAMIVVSGTHGAEGFCGSAIQHRWLAERGGRRFGGLKIVLVHAVNPWAFSFKTRTTENNVDLNRNFVADFSAFPRANPSYDRLAPFLHAVELDAREQLAAWTAYRRYLDAHGWRIEGEVWAGQSHRPDGLYYSGLGPEWSNRTFRAILADHLRSAATVGFIDWHTCIGQFGETVHLIFDAPGSAERDAATGWWGLAAPADAAFKSGATPRYEGLLCRAVGEELAAVRVAGAVIEFGTVDDFTLFRADRLERWLHFEGRGHPEHRRLCDAYREVCCPSDLAWRRMVLAEGPAMMDRLAEGVLAWA